MTGGKEKAKILLGGRPIKPLGEFRSFLISMGLSLIISQNLISQGHAFLMGPEMLGTCTLSVTDSLRKTSEIATEPCKILDGGDDEKSIEIITLTSGVEYVFIFYNDAGIGTVRLTHYVNGAPTVEELGELEGMDDNCIYFFMVEADTHNKLCRQYQ